MNNNIKILGHPAESIALAENSTSVLNGQGARAARPGRAADRQGLTKRSAYGTTVR